jgi:hypothetical protein
MSYDIFFTDPLTRKTIELNDVHFMRGGTYAVGGTKKLHLNITFNYARNYAKHNFGIKDLIDKTALEAIPELERVIALLGDDVSDDYWEATDGNAKQALISLLTMAKMRPDAVIEVDY